jgi:[acyl-carrier-protein] S-malonyltransferase
MGIDPERVQAICAEAAQGEVVSAANFNGPGQVVIAGSAAAVERAGKLASAEKARVMPLKVSAPFHCSLMEPAARAVGAELERIAIRDPRFPVVANFDAAPNTQASRVKDLLVRQVCGAVRWDESVRLMASSGARHALEIGPGRKLAGLVKRITKELEVLPVDDAASIEKVSAFLAGG